MDGTIVGGQQGHGLLPVARVTALEPGIAAGPGQLRSVASLSAVSQGVLEVGNDLVNIHHGLCGEAQQAVWSSKHQES